eukprot:6209309-Pleurochrysis_carterae.AAC.2
MTCWPYDKLSGSMISLLQWSVRHEVNDKFFWWLTTPFWRLLPNADPADKVQERSSAKQFTTPKLQLSRSQGMENSSARSNSRPPKNDSMNDSV